MTNDKKLDELILSRTDNRWRKVAMIIGAVMLDEDNKIPDDIDDMYLADRVKHLAKIGRLESRGDLDEIRYSEIRLSEIQNDA